MAKKTLLLTACLALNIAYAGEYSLLKTAGTIHVTTVQSSSFCANLAVSTKLGHQSSSQQCIYDSETTPESFDTCTFELNGSRLEQLAGSGYDCAATHIHSNLTGDNSIDEYRLISDEVGHYIGTDPAEGSVAIN